MRIRSLLLFAAVLLASLAWMGIGLWLARDGADRLGHYETIVGIDMVFPSSIFIPIILTAIVNRFVPAERARLRRRPIVLAPVFMMLLVSTGFALLLHFGPRARHGHAPFSSATTFWLVAGFWIFILLLAAYRGRQVRGKTDLPARSPLQAQLRIRQLERGLKHLHWMRRRPEAVFAFLFGALMLLVAVAFAPTGFPNPQGNAMLHAWGRIFGLYYLILFVVFLRTLVTRRWESYINGWTVKTERRLNQARMDFIRLSGTNPENVRTQTDPPGSSASPP